MAQEDYESFLSQQVENIVRLRNQTGGNIESLVEAYMTGIEAAESFRHFEGKGDDSFAKELKLAAKNYVDPLTKRAHEEFPGEHVFYSGDKVVAHGQDVKQVYEEFLRNHPEAKGSFLFRVDPKGEPKREYASRPHGIEG